MASRTFPIEFRDITWDITVDYDEDDKTKWWMTYARPQDNHEYAELDRLCHINQCDFAATGVDDAMDSVHAEIDEKLRRGE